LLACAISHTCASNTHTCATHFSCALAARLSTLLDLPEDQMEESLSSLVVKKTVYVAPPIPPFFQHPNSAHVTNHITTPSQCLCCVSKSPPFPCNKSYNCALAIFMLCFKITPLPMSQIISLRPRNVYVVFQNHPPSHVTNPITAPSQCSRLRFACSNACDSLTFVNASEYSDVAMHVMATP
jgi:hypothetical protein